MIALNSKTSPFKFTENYLDCRVKPDKDKTKK